MFNKILIVNRGEIAVRIIRACKELGIGAAVIYSDDDKYSLHVRSADEAYYIGESKVSESYLNVNKIIKLAIEINADAIHPGYGFLSENAHFIGMVENSGITFIGPSSQSVRLMGNKTSARKLMVDNNVPVVPGTTSSIEDVENAKKICREIGYPIMLKASAGGGGKGMRRIFNENEFSDAFVRAQNESLKAFGSSDIYIEKYLKDPKHIEVQIFGDKFGSYIHLFERECSVQRRHQKIIEEAPSAAINENLRKKITLAAIEVAKACNYINAGTVEFLMDNEKKFYFLEMNTRLQVEHPVTEMITGIDIVKEQINVAAGNKLSVKQLDISRRGHAIECRIYAEDVENNFAPSIGKITYHKLPSGPGIRVDRGIDEQSVVSVYYDPILSKVAVWGRDREEAINRMRRALNEYQIAGVLTNIQACRWVLSQKSFLDGRFDINFIEKEFLPLLPGKWKEPESEQIEEAVIILSALLKFKNSKLKPITRDLSSYNHWIELRHE